MNIEKKTDFKPYIEYSNLNLYKFKCFIRFIICYLFPYPSSKALFNFNINIT